MKKNLFLCGVLGTAMLCSVYAETKEYTPSNITEFNAQYAEEGYTLSSDDILKLLFGNGYNTHTLDTEQAAAVTPNLTLNGGTLNQDDSTWKLTGTTTVAASSTISTPRGKVLTIAKLSDGADVESPADVVLTLSRGGQDGAAYTLTQLTGENNFSGKIKLSNPGSGTHALVLSNKDAVSRAAVELGNDKTMLALNVAEASVRSITGNGAVVLASKYASNMQGCNNLSSATLTMDITAATNVSVKLGDGITLKNTGSARMTYTSDVGNGATLEGIINGDGESNVKYTANYHANSGTLKNVLIENLDAGSSDASIIMDGVYGYFRNNANVQTVTLTGKGFRQTNGNVNGGITFKILKGDGNYERDVYTNNQTHTLQNAEEWTGRYINGESTTSINLQSATGATFVSSENGTLTLNLKANGIVAGITTETGSTTTINVETDKTVCVTNATISGNTTITLGERASLATAALTFNAGSKVTLGTLDNHDHDLAATNLTVNGDAEMYGNLVLNGGTITFSDGVVLTMGSDVTIGTDGAVTVALTEAMVAKLAEGNNITLFKGVDKANLGIVNFSGGVGDYMLALNQGNIVISSARIPEPTTGALSLLALAGLCARRRKH